MNQGECNSAHNSQQPSCDIISIVLQNVNHQGKQQSMQRIYYFLQLQVNLQVYGMAGVGADKITRITKGKINRIR